MKKTSLPRRRRYAAAADSVESSLTSLLQTDDAVPSTSASSVNFDHVYNHADTFPDDLSAMPPGRERTQEFNAFAKSLQMKMTASNNVQRRRPNVEAIQFSQVAKQIAHNLSQTFVKLEKLTMLAKKRTLFDERVGEVDQLTHIIKQDIASLNGQISNLQQLIHGNGGGGRLSNQTQHSKSVVVNFQSRLATMSTDFKNLLEMRTENMKHQRLRREQFSSTQLVPSTMPASSSKGSLLLNDNEYDHHHQQQQQHVVDMELLERRQAQMQITDSQDDYIQSRADTMANIETTIVELGQIFAQLGRMVQEQGEVVQRIDSNVDQTALHVESAHMELVKYFRNISRNRWLAIKVFAVLVGLFIFFVLFML